MTSYNASTIIDFLGSGTDQQNDLSGSISSMPQPKGRRTPLQDVDLNTDFDTLDEPVWDTIMRDARTIGSKFTHVLFPGSRDKTQLLRDWDLWGPLFICVFLSLLLHSQGGEAAPQFTQVFTLTFFGSVIVTLNIKLLGGQISFFQSLCVIGYCLLPPSLAALLCSIIGKGNLFVVHLTLTAVGFLWATYAAMGFLSSLQAPKRQLLVVYPIFLFYFIVSWLILSHT
ncbi:unnamed protein product, partial [Mesorhabditis belari]|uniref:Protein YIPF n=1 Tax=Mesorhabditis belari TaxID=2138241 RepID=A0AAF3ES19_9BILA